MNNVSKHFLNKECCGCFACMNICPRSCISFSRNSHGYYNPIINSDCISCGKCLKVCQIDSENDYPETKLVLGCRTRDDELLLSSSSGGMFSEICLSFQKLKSSETVVWGAAFDNELNVVHICNNVNNIGSIKGSKYVQSCINDAYSIIEKQLKSGINVVFSGTACQCVGLRKYMSERNIQTNNLLVIDVVCHGAGSPDVWNSYIDFIEKQEHIKIIDYKFRNKKIAWRGFHPEIYTPKGIYILKDSDVLMSYTKLYGSLNLNETCFNCKYTNLNRPGDLSLGDYWGVENSDIDLNDNRGVSICLVNTSLGLCVYDDFKNNTICYEVNDNSYLQPQLISPVNKSVRYKSFWKDYVNKGYQYVYKKYTIHGKFYFGFRKLYKLVFHR